MVETIGCLPAGFRGSAINFPQSLLSDSCLWMKKPQFWLINMLFLPKHGVFPNRRFWKFIVVILPLAVMQWKTKRKLVRSLQLSKITLEIVTRCFAINE